MSSNLQQQNLRIDLVDALRGFALLGIILANLPVEQANAAASYWFSGSERWNETLRAIINILISTKFISIFSILFGFGFYTQLQNAAARDIKFRSYFLFRMILLFLIGCLHAYVFWFGDILRYYAICGVFLLLLQQMPNKRLLRIALLFIVPLTALVFILNGVLELQQYDYDMSIPQKLYHAASYTQYFMYNLTIDPMVNFVQDSPLTLVSCFGKVLFGYWLARIGFFRPSNVFAQKLQRNIWWLLLTGLLGSWLFWAISSGSIELSLPLLWLPFLVAGVLFIHSLFYIAGFMRLFNNAWGLKVLQIFIPIGKMALTNYLLQTAFYLLVFYRWTGGLYLAGKLSVAEIYLLGFCFYLVQLFLSRLWLNHFKQGPVEWVWKKLAYKAFVRNIQAKLSDEFEVMISK